MHNCHTAQQLVIIFRLILQTVLNAQFLSVGEGCMNIKVISRIKIRNVKKLQNGNIPFLDLVMLDFQ